MTLQRYKTFFNYPNVLEKSLFCLCNDKYTHKIIEKQTIYKK